MSEDVPLAVLKARSASPTKVLSKQRKSRKRSFWQSDSEIGIDGSRQVEASKRKKSDKRKLSKRKSEQVEHKFLIGGDISDPLNLKTDELPGVDDVDVSSSSHREDDHYIPRVPHLQTDPLQLEDSVGSDQLTSKEQKSKKKRKRKRKTSESQREETNDRVCVIKSAINECEEPEMTEAVIRTTITSSVEIKNTPADSRILLEVCKPVTSKLSYVSSARKFKEQNACRFRYGNYYRYYGYRNPGGMQDERLAKLKPEWFEGKKCLDIGCNVGHFTLCIARDFKPKLVIGLDIDGHLISIAKKNIRHYLSPMTCDVDGKQVEFPLSLVKSFGPIAGFPLPGKERDGYFPSNVKFQAGNWVVKTDAHLGEQKAEYDVVLLLSTTKWIHLNWGDEGLKRAFKRIFLALKPGGIFIMEPQELRSYKKKKKLTSDMFANYKAMQLYPDQFSDYLLSEVGFSSSQELRSVDSGCKGFTRPILLYTKPDESQL